MEKKFFKVVKSGEGYAIEGPAGFNRDYNFFGVAEIQCEVLNTAAAAIAAEAVAAANQEQKTLRDEFAMSALNGLLSDSRLNGGYDQFAQEAYRNADAMLEARK